MAFRYLEVSRYYSNMDSLLRAQFAYPEATFRHTVAPSAKMPSNLEPLSLKLADVDTIYELGVSDGVAEANASSTDDLTHYFALKKKHDQRLKGGVSFEKFLEMKKNGEFDAAFKLTEDKYFKSIFLQ